MKKKITASARYYFLLLIALLVVGASISAQEKKENKVKIKVITSEGEKVVDMDTTFNHDVMVFHTDGDTKVLNMDSILKAHDIDEHVKVMAYKLDSLNDFNFEMEGDMENMHIEIERILKEKGIVMEDIGEMHGEGRKSMIFIGEDGEVDIDKYIDDEGRKSIFIKKGYSSGDCNKTCCKKVIVNKGGKSSMSWTTNTTHTTTARVEAIPVDDISFLKELGVSTKMLLNDPINVDELKVKIEHIIKNGVEQTIMQIECELPEGKYELEMFNKEGETVKEDKELEGGPLKQDFELSKDEAPYYMILSKNNRLFGRKVTL